MGLYDKIVRPTTQMLLKRMDDHPEDFDGSTSGVYGSKSWLAVAKHGEFNLYERHLINKRVKANRRKETEQKILELLLDGQAREEDYDVQTMHTTTGRFSGLSPAAIQRAEEKQI